MLPYTWCALTATVPPLPSIDGGLLFCGTIPYGHPRRPLAGILPYGARTFLEFTLAIAFHTCPIQFSIDRALGQFKS